MMTGPIYLCSGAYHRLADEAGNRAAAGLLALARLADHRRMADEGTLLVAIYDALHWAETLHGRLRLCPSPCDLCDAAREAEKMRGG